MAQLMIVIASTRPGRVASPVATWFAQRGPPSTAASSIKVVDLAELNLPLLDEPNHPRLRQYTKAAHAGLERDGRRGRRIRVRHARVQPRLPAALKNAIDYLHHEWRYKPVGFVSYGGVAAGTRAVQQLKQVVTAVGMMPDRAGQHPVLQQFINDEGDLQANEVMETRPWCCSISLFVSRKS